MVYISSNLIDSFNILMVPPFRTEKGPRNTYHIYLYGDPLPLLVEAHPTHIYGARAEQLKGCGPLLPTPSVAVAPNNKKN